jgi:UDP-N-acetylmuramoyl-L-alanyl-D-glutamate--2,6-diaminopimelate ligase
MECVRLHLNDLIHAAGGGTAPGIAPVDITGITSDSRSVEPGFLFAAVPGLSVDGRDFIEDALARGAQAVLAPSGVSLDKEATARGVQLVTNDNPRRGLALMAARFYDAQPRVTAAVTGTNGKTSVAWFTRQIWTHLGHKAASMGTLGIHAPGRTEKGSLTTPDPVALHRELAELAATGVDHLALEASSHGLSQHRLDGIAISAGAFTNLSRDHLDYHRTMADYRAAKLRLFETLLSPGAAAVLNADTVEFESFSDACNKRGCRVIGYGEQGREIRLEALTPTPHGLDLSVYLFGKQREISLPLPGAFQAANALCALGLVVACGDDSEAAIAALPELEGVPGRLQLAARRDNGAPIYVDYAHTPDALSNVLGALRPHTDGKLFVVFGCGGDRDPGKRPMMGKIANDLADIAIVTDDNPRGEASAPIRSQIMDGCPDARNIGDRAEAISVAASELRPGDLLVVAGKGHETGQIVGDKVLPFDDVLVAQNAVSELDGGAS